MEICKTCRQPIKNTSKYLWILENGHGGIIDGVYQTAGKRSPIWSDGTQLFEGEFNRSIVKRLIKLCEKANIDYVNLVDTNVDVSLAERTSKANEIYRNTKAQAEFPTYKMRKDYRDGDADKEANFYVLRNTAMPAILSENFFMTNEKECRLIMSEEGRDRIAKIHFEMIQQIEKCG